ncbi:MAG: alpha-2-macroglobulin family protein [Pyrinomonadaceae bacterium]
MKKITAWILLLAIYTGLLAPAARVIQAQEIQKARNERMKDLPAGLKFSLAEGVEGAENREMPPPAQTDPLGDEETAALLKRVPDIKTDPDDKQDFAKRVGSLAAPKKGDRIPVKFPAAESRPIPGSDREGELEVVRFTPEGEVNLAPDLTVTFSHPMVAVTGQEDASKTVPVSITPSIEGRWRWLGTKTLMFDTDKRFNMASVYKVSIPAGTKSATGQVLQKEVSWTFTTPPPKMVRYYPTSNIANRNEVMYIEFDQKIDPDSMLSKINVFGGKTKMNLRLLTEEELKGSSAFYYSKNAEPGRWLAFRAVNADGSTENALPGDTSILVSVPKGSPSAEGPRTTEADQQYGFRTYGPMKYVEGFCGYKGNSQCTPFDNWYLRYTNPIDGSKFDPSMVTITPKVEGLKIYPSGSGIYISGVKKGKTRYTVAINDEVYDTFGQKASGPGKAVINVGSAPLMMYSQGGTMVIQDPSAKTPAYSVYSTNHTQARLKVYRVEPKNWNQFAEFLRYRNYEDGNKRSIPGTLIGDSTIAIENKPDEVVETRVALAKYLKGGYGNIILDLEPVKKRDKYDRTRITVWVQATQIGLDAFVDSSELVGFATELKTGKPLGGVDLSIYPNGAAVSAAPKTETSESYLSKALDWVLSWTTSGPSPSMDERGNALEMEEIGRAASNVTPANGMLRLPLPATSAKEPNMLIAKRGADTAFLPENPEYYYRQSGSWYETKASDTLRWFSFDDRKLYKPKEEVSVKGYVRRITAGKLGDVTDIGDISRDVSYKIFDPRGNEIGSGDLTLNAFGAFDMKFKLPDAANLGYGRVEFRSKSGVAGSVYSHSFQIQEFRRPEFEVSSKVVSEGPHFVGGSANVEVEAKYYAGGGLANAQTNWVVSATPTNYTPPNRSDYVFGTWVPWWYGGRDFYSPGNTQYFQGKTDASGKHNLKINFESVNPPRPYSISASSSVQDVNRQTWSSRTSLLVHPADLYIGLKSERTFVQKGEKIKLSSIISDIDGNLESGRAGEVRALLKSWEFEKGAWVEKTVDEQFCKFTSSDEASKCEFTAKEGGRYIITASVMDDRERFNETEITVWVAGGKIPPQRDVSQERVELIPDKKDYKPGDVAELLVIAPFTPSEGVLTLRREGIVSTKRFSVTDSSVTLKVPIEEAYLPNIFAQVDLVGSAVRTDDKGEPDLKLAKRPAFASGSLNLSVSTETRELTVMASPKESTLEPGGATEIDVKVENYKGEPVGNTEVAVVVVDESVLALTGYSLSDPLGVFYGSRGTGTRDYHSRAQVLLGNPLDISDKLTNQASPPPPPSPMVSEVAISGGVANARKSVGRAQAQKPGAEMDLMVADEERTDDSPEDGAINLRKDFNALAVWTPSVKTDSGGRAVVPVKLPDNLTRYRVMAVSVDAAKRFGKGESSLTARQPLMVRPSAPRFMNFGDKVELPVVIQNQTDKDMLVDIGTRSTNARLTAGGGRKVTVKANDRVEVRFPAAAEKAGTARFQFVATAGKFSDAAEIEFPVWTPATTEAFATYGTTDKNGAIIQPVAMPNDVFTQFGGLEVTTSSTQLQELTDAFIYLYRYQFECTEQISSRMLSIAALRDVLTAFKSEDMPSEADIKARFAQDMKILSARQNSNGYFGLWRRDNERYKYPFVTAHVAHALVLAKMKGYDVPDAMLKKVAPYLKDIEKHYDEWHRHPQVRWTISSYALYVRNLMGDNDAGKAKKLLAEATIEKMPFEALGWLLPVLADSKDSDAEINSIKRYLLNRTSETAATAQFNTSYDDGGWLIMNSNRRADAVLLEALLKLEARDAANNPGATPTDLIPKLTRGLLDHRTKGRWSNTQENVFVLLALDKYFQAYEKVTPDFVTKVWLGAAYAGEQKFKGRSVDFNQLDIPMSYLAEQGGAADLIFDKQGPGRLYYRIGMKYAPKNLNLEPADYGFTVLRNYEAVDYPADVSKDEKGRWVIKAGSRVRVRLTMVAPARRYHVALVDPLPAGLEILNPGLAVTEDIPPAPVANTSVATVGSRSYGFNSYYWRLNWFEHQNFRDERAEAFSSLVWGGVYNYNYVTRATTPGEFVAPPAKAEEMYHPETFGRSGTDFVVVR